MTREALELTIASLRQEIAAHIQQLIYGVIMAATLIAVVYLVAEMTARIPLYQFTVMLFLTAVYFVAVKEYAFHRPAEYIKLAESKLAENRQAGGEAAQSVTDMPGWEEWKDSRKARVWFLPLADLLAASAFFWIFYRCQSVLWQSHQTFVYVTTAGLLFGILWCAVGVWVAGK